MHKIGIVNYGVGNLKSVKNSLDYLNIPNLIADKPSELKSVEKIILPGVGAFGAAIEKLNRSGFGREIDILASKKMPILGICLGMQLLLQESHEHGIHQGLGLVGGKVLPFSLRVKNLPIPLIGWNNIRKKNSESPLLKNIEDNACFYFVHSFYCQPDKKSVIAATADYGMDFPAIIENGNIYGCQFHPEKSQSSGLQILKNFSEL